MKKLLFFVACFVACCSVNAQAIERGYRGFVNVSYVGGNDGVYVDWNHNGFAINTVHGYQFNDNVFFGFGVQYNYHTFEHFERGYSLPLFADVRFDFSSGKVTPFIEAKVGYSVADYDGFYASPAFGIRMATNSKLAFNLSLAYSAQRFEYRKYYSALRYWNTGKGCLHDLNITFGVEF